MKSMTYRVQTFVVGIVGLWAIGVPLQTGVAFNITLTVINTGVFLVNEMIWRRTNFLKPKPTERDILGELAHGKHELPWQFEFDFRFRCRKCWYSLFRRKLRWLSNRN